jgi:hypothetical protein
VPFVPNGLDPSRSAKPDRDLAFVDDHRHRASPVGEPEHPLELVRFLLDVDVFDLDMPPLVIVTGGSGVRSTVLAEDDDHLPIVPGLVISGAGHPPACGSRL